MAATSIAPRFVFGFRADVANNVAYAEDGAVVYPAGHNVVLYSPDIRTQRLIPGTLESEGISAMCVSANKKLLAVAERSEKAIITVYDLQTLKRRKVLVAPDVGSKEYVSLSFSADGKLLLAQGGGPEWNMVLWVWEKSKIAGTVKTTNQQGLPVFACNYSPGDGGMIGVLGQNIFKVLKYLDGTIKALNFNIGKRDMSTIACMEWVPPDSNDLKEKLLLGTTEGEVLLLEHGTEFKNVFSCENTGGGLVVQCIVCYSKGFVVGQDGGVVTIFEKDDKEMYRRARAFTIENNPVKIKHVAISPSEEHLTCSLENGQVYSLLLSNSEIMKADEMNFDVLGTNNHQGPVTGMDMCVRKPLIASCSTDKSVRLWNYNDRTCELVKWFPDEIFSIAIHPSGLQVLVGFADKLRLMTILMEDLKTVKEFGIKGCRECCFSTGGQYFAAVNGTTISIYNTYTCENVGNLRGHNGKVRSVHWAPDDAHIVSAGMDGAVYEWRLKDFKREKENVLKGCNYTSVLSTPDCKTLYAAGSDRKIKEFEEAPGAGTQITKEVDTGVPLTQICLLPNIKMMIAATDTGNLRTYKYPLTGEFAETKCHQGSITRLRLSWDEQLVATASDDGSVFVHDVKDRDAKAAARREQERVEYSAEVLVTRSDLDEKRNRMAELEQQVAELTMQTEYQLRLKDLHLQEKTKELTEKFTSEVDVDRQKFELLLAEKNEQEMEYEEKLKQAEERSQVQLAALDTQYQAKIMAEVERFQQLAQEKEALNERWDEQNSLLVESHERVIAELTEDYEAKLAEESLRLEQLLTEKTELEREFEEIKRQLEEDADREIEELKEKYEVRLAGEREASLRLKGENGIMRKKFNALQKDIEAQKEEIKNLFEQKRELYATIASLEKDIASLKREIRERDETIGDKERRIYDLKKKNQELEKFKFVLDYKIKELKKQIEPREAEILEMKDQIKEMDGELERYHKTNSGLDLLISNLKLKQTGLSGEVTLQRRSRTDLEALIKRMQHDLQQVVGSIQDPKALKEKVKQLYHKYCADMVAGEHEEDNDLEREAARQRGYLEKTVDSLRRKLAKDSELHRSDNLRIMQENTALIKEINELRREARSLRARGAGSPAATGNATALAFSKRPTLQTMDAELVEGLKKELEMQRDLIYRLREDGATKVARIKQLETMVVPPRPLSRERLPPMDPSTTTAYAVNGGAPLTPQQQQQQAQVLAAKESEAAAARAKAEAAMAAMNSARPPRSPLASLDRPPSSQHPAGEEGYPLPRIPSRPLSRTGSATAGAAAGAGAAESAADKAAAGAATGLTAAAASGGLDGGAEMEAVADASAAAAEASALASAADEEVRAGASSGGNDSGGGGEGEGGVQGDGGEGESTQGGEAEAAAADQEQQGEGQEQQQQQQEGTEAGGGLQGGEEEQDVGGQRDQNEDVNAEGQEGAGLEAGGEGAQEEGTEAEHAQSEENIRQGQEGAAGEEQGEQGGGQEEGAAGQSEARAEEGGLEEGSGGQKEEGGEDGGEAPAEGGDNEPAPPPPAPPSDAPDS
mmetsp:Transcript_22834/g.63112  ORF Transcript_22834/g.63112 Transcript_22834/m.63112 type:complete len:1547 (+) Transcript_22834:150-4790(+)